MPSTTHATVTTYAEAAPYYTAKGWKPIPLPPKAKQFPPAGATGHGGTVTDIKIRDWMTDQFWANGNTALRVEGVLGVDVDNYDSKEGFAQLLDIEASVGVDLPPTYYSTSRGAGQDSSIRFYRVPDGMNFVGKADTDIELVQQSHRYAIVWPSVHPTTGNTYQWYDPQGNPCDIPEKAQLAELPLEYVNGWRVEKSRVTHSHTGLVEPINMDVDMQEWVDSLTVGPLSPMLEKKMQTVPDFSAGRYEDINKAVWALAEFVAYYPKESGAKSVYERIVRARLTSPSASTPEEQRITDIRRSFRGAIAKHVHERDVEKVGEMVEWAVENSSDSNTEKFPKPPPALDDSLLAEWVAFRLEHILCWSGGLGWMFFDDKVWNPVGDPDAVEIVRLELKSLLAQEIPKAQDAARIKSLSQLLQSGKIRAVLGLVKGIVSKDAKLFDTRKDFLNCNNGMVDLRTGILYQHSSRYLFTKITKTNYVPNATHPDWDKALVALPLASRSWMQVRFGQAITGHMTPDDLLPILQGGGSNGKSAVTGAIFRTLGGFATMVPDRLLLANPGDHPTELTTLMGARFALMEETPETRHLNVKRLKDVLGTPTMTARKIAKDNITWEATHSLFLTTNYTPQIAETDDGTWRRLALVIFPYSFRKVGEPLRTSKDMHGDPNLRDRLLQGRHQQHEAVLSWLVQGAMMWYAADQEMPELPQNIQKDRDEWRGDSDHILNYITERLDFDPQSKIVTTELLSDFNAWLTTQSASSWGDTTFSSRFKRHYLIEQNNITKVRTANTQGLSRPGTFVNNPLPAQPVVWAGVKFKAYPSPY